MKTQFLPYQTAPIIAGTNKTKPNQKPTGNQFAHALQQNLEPMAEKLSISKHAKIRLEQRNIDIKPETWSKMESKLVEARKMGVKDSLVLLDNAALIVSAKNNTVITAMGREEATSQIFTNINGTILMD